MLNKDTILILGSSPELNTIKDNFFKIKNKYIDITMNRSIFFNPRTEYWLFSDLGSVPYYKEEGIDYNKYNNKIITTYEVNKYELNKENIKPFYLFNSTCANNFKINENSFPMYKTSLHACLGFSVMQGYKNAVLIGIDLDTNWNYFNGKEKQRPQKRIDKMREVLYKYKKYINIYKTNKDNTLDLDCIDIRDL